MSDSRIRGLYNLPVAERIARLEALGWLAAADARALTGGHHVLSVGAADRMIENVIGVFGLPLAVAPNFLVNGRDCVVPLVVEEPSIVAGLSSAAALARVSGGFEVTNTESLLIDRRCRRRSCGRDASGAEGSADRRGQCRSSAARGARRRCPGCRVSPV